MKNISKEKIIIIDNIGILKNLYKYCDCAYIGGGFGKGIHNILEPAAYNLPIIFGTNYKKFKEAEDFISLGFASSIKNHYEFEEALKNIINKLSERKISKYLKDNSGAVKKILDIV